MLARGDIVDHNQVAAAANLVAESGRDGQLAAWLQTEGDLIPNGAGDPAIFGDSRHCCINPSDCGQILNESVNHDLSSHSGGMGFTIACNRR